MPTIIKKAETTAEIDDVLELRYKVLTQANRTPNRMFQLTKKVSDHFDVYPDTINIVTYNSGQALASIRAVRYGETSTLNETFDYSESYKNVDGKCHYIDMLCITKEFSGHEVIKLQLIKGVLHQLALKGINYAFFNIPGELYEICKSIGFQRIGEPLSDSNFDFEIVPSIINLETYYDQFTQTITDKEILRFQEVFYNIIFEPGEILIVQGEKGSTAYLIENGEVEILIKPGDEIVPISTISKGSLIGEIAMITSEVRTASIMAKETTSCIAFDREEFIEIMYEHPNRVLDIFKIFSKRLDSSNKKIAELSKNN